MQIKQRDKRFGAHFTAASDHKVVPCRIPFFLAFRVMHFELLHLMEENSNHFSQPDVHLFRVEKFPSSHRCLASRLSTF